MNILTISAAIAILGFLLGLAGILLRLRDIMNRPFKQEYSRQRGSITRGVLYAFTLGMAPWEKESTRKHWIAYLRGIFFHVGIFTAIAVLLASPWLDLLPPWLKWIGVAITALGAVFGLAGIVMRLSGPNERLLSLPDDYASVFLTGLFIACASLTLAWTSFLPVFYILAGVMMAYIPLSKIRHCVYFFYSKFFFGFNFGRRGVIGQPKSSYSE